MSSDQIHKTKVSAKIECNGLDQAVKSRVEKPI